MILLIKEDVNLKKLEVYMNRLLKKDIYKDKHIECCPICGSSEYIKYGSYKEIQRYKCKECRKTFSKATNSLWSYSKKDAKIWVEFIELMMEKKSLRFCADKLKINLATAFYWRHKILHGLALDVNPNELKGDIYISKALIPENFKGCRNILTPLRHNIWIVAAKGMEDSMLVKRISRGFWDLNSFNEKIYSKIDKKAYIIPYADRYISVLAAKHNKKIIKETSDENRIRFFRNHLNKWLRSFYGVATKYLEEYISLFIFFMLEKTFNYIDFINYLTLGDRFIKTKEIGVG